MLNSSYLISPKPLSVSSRPQRHKGIHTLCDNDNTMTNNNKKRRRRTEHVTHFPFQVVHPCLKSGSLKPVRNGSYLTCESTSSHLPAVLAHLWFLGTLS